MTSAFGEAGMQATVEQLVDRTRALYLEDEVPWVVGYSGGKDSTATLQLVWLALRGLEPDQLHKPVHVISTDTLVENPVVAAWVSRSLEVMREAASRSGLPLTPHRLTPAVEDTFWVNLIGKGYPAPRPKFRWCTERMKIRPSNGFIRSVVQESGEAILVLGTRKAESQARARAMARAETGRIRDQLSPNASLPNSLVFSPIEDWSNDDVWLFLMQVENQWGFSNKDLLTMYQGASEDGECPLVVDTTTPSCGDSRFGCWTCTLVEKDKSMQAMIQNDDEKEWMLPLLKLRDELDVSNDRDLRDFRRLTGRVQLMGERVVPGPYTQEARADWLRKLLEAQVWIRDNGPEEMRTLELVTQEELREIRRIWVVDKHEFEDLLPLVFEEVTGDKFDGPELEGELPIGRSELEILSEICGGDRVHYELVRDLIDVERKHRLMARRAGLFSALEEVLERGAFDSEEDAIAFATERDSIRNGPDEPVLEGAGVDEFVQPSRETRS